MARRNPKLRAFVKVRKNGEVIPASLIYRKKEPKDGTWIEITANSCCTTSTTTTTTGV